MESQREERHVPSDTDDNTCAPSRHFPQFANGRPPGHQKTPARIPILKLLNFYFGVTLSLCGVGAFVTGASSSKWVEIEVRNPTLASSNGLRLEHHHRTLSNFGPWRVCTYEKHCDTLWTVAPGLDKQSVRGTQFMLLLAILIYLTGASIIVLQLVRPKCIIDRCECLFTTALAESLFPIAAVLAFLSMLMMGELKRRLILQVNQTSHPGWAFVVCLTAILATVIGDICMIFNRKRSSNWLISSCAKQLQMEIQGRGKGTTGTRRPPEPVAASLRSRSDLQHVATHVADICDARGSQREEGEIYCASYRRQNDVVSNPSRSEPTQASFGRCSDDDRTRAAVNSARPRPITRSKGRLQSVDEIALNIATLPRRDVPPLLSADAESPNATKQTVQHVQVTQNSFAI